MRAEDWKLSEQQLNVWRGERELNCDDSYFLNFNKFSREQMKIFQSRITVY